MGEIVNNVFKEHHKLVIDKLYNCVSCNKLQVRKWGEKAYKLWIVLKNTQGAYKES